MVIGDPGGDPGTGSGDPGGGSGDPGSGSSGGSGATGHPSGNCDVTGATLRLCASFGSDPIAQDLLAPPHAVVEASGILPIGGIINSVAGSFDGASHLRFAESPDFDVHDLTIAFWMLPTSRPGKNRHDWMLDNNLQYFASYESDGSVRCGIGNTAIASKASVPTNTWHHVACTYSSADQTLRVYVDGNLGGCTGAGAIPQGGRDGIAIGANFNGGGYRDNYRGRLDTLHLYASALSPGDVCSAAGKANCSSRCPN
jgi:hypothetical protein